MSTQYFYSFNSFSY